MQQRFSATDYAYAVGCEGHLLCYSVDKLEVDTLNVENLTSFEKHFVPAVSVSSGMDEPPSKMENAVVNEPISEGTAMWQASQLGHINSSFVDLGQGVAFALEKIENITQGIGTPIKEEMERELANASLQVVKDSSQEEGESPNEVVLVGNISDQREDKKEILITNQRMEEGCFYVATDVFYLQTDATSAFYPVLKIPSVYVKEQLTKGPQKDRAATQTITLTSFVNAVVGKTLPIAEDGKVDDNISSATGFTYDDSMRSVGTTYRIEDLLKVKQALSQDGEMTSSWLNSVIDLKNRQLLSYRDRIVGAGRGFAMRYSNIELLALSQKFLKSHKESTLPSLDIYMRPRHEDRGMQASRGRPNYGDAALLRNGGTSPSLSAMPLPLAASPHLCYVPFSNFPPSPHTSMPPPVHLSSWGGTGSSMSPSNARLPTNSGAPPLSLTSNASMGGIISPLNHTSTPVMRSTNGFHHVLQPSSPPISHGTPLSAPLAAPPPMSSPRVSYNAGNSTPLCLDSPGLLGKQPPVGLSPLSPRFSLYRDPPAASLYPSEMVTPPYGKAMYSTNIAPSEQHSKSISNAAGGFKIFSDSTTQPTNGRKYSYPGASSQTVSPERFSDKKEDASPSSYPKSGLFPSKEVPGRASTDNLFNSFSKDSLSSHSSMIVNGLNSSIDAKVVPSHEENSSSKLSSVFTKASESSLARECYLADSPSNISQMTDTVTKNFLPEPALDASKLSFCFEETTKVLPENTKHTEAKTVLSKDISTETDINKTLSFFSMEDDFIQQNISLDTASSYPVFSEDANGELELHNSKFAQWFKNSAPAPPPVLTKESVSRSTEVGREAGRRLMAMLGVKTLTENTSLSTSTLSTAPSSTPCQQGLSFHSKGSVSSDKKVVTDPSTRFDSALPMSNHPARIGRKINVQELFKFHEQGPSAQG